MSSGVATSGQLRKRAAAVFDPGAEPGLDLEAWWDVGRSVVSGGRIVSIPNRGPLARTLVRPSGSVGPLFDGANTRLRKVAAIHVFDNVTDQSLACSNLTLWSAPFTLMMIGYLKTPIAGQSPEQVGRLQSIIKFAQHFIFTSTGLLKDDLYTLVASAVQVESGVAWTTNPNGVFALLIVFNNGSSSAIYSSTSFPDIKGNLGQYQRSASMTVGGYSSFYGPYQFDGGWSDLILWNSVPTASQVTRAMLWAQSTSHMSVTFDDPGTRYRNKWFYVTSSGTPFDSPNYFVNAPDATLLLTPSGGLRVRFRFHERNGDHEHLASDVVLWSQGTALVVARKADGRLAVHINGTDYESTIHVGWGADAEVSVFVAVGAGLPIQAAFQAEKGAPWIDVPFGPATVAAISSASLVGKLDFGGNRAVSSTASVTGIELEAVAYNDGAVPLAFTPPIYPAGALVFEGEKFIDPGFDGGWPSALLEGLTLDQKAFPRPSQVGVAGTSAVALTARAAASVDAQLVAGATSVLVLMWIGMVDIPIGPMTPTAAYNALATYVAARQSAGWTGLNKIVVCTYPANPNITSSTTPSESFRQAFNALLLATPLGDRVADVGALTQFVSSNGDTPTREAGIVIANVVKPHVEAVL